MRRCPPPRPRCDAALPPRSAAPPPQPEPSLLRRLGLDPLLRRLGLDPLLRCLSLDPLPAAAARSYAAPPPQPRFDAAPRPQPDPTLLCGLSLIRRCSSAAASIRRCSSASASMRRCSSSSPLATSESPLPLPACALPRPRLLAAVVLPSVLRSRWSHSVSSRRRSTDCRSIGLRHLGLEICRFNFTWPRFNRLGIGLDVIPGWALGEVLRALSL
jgi:hypothetical protein